MRIANAKENLIIDFKEGRVPVLALENMRVFSEFVSDIYFQMNGEDGDIVLSEGENLLALSRTAVMVCDYFSLDFNQRKILNVLYKNMQAAAADFTMEKDKLTEQGINLLDKIVDSLRFDHVEYDFELDWNTLFKAFDVRIEEDYASIPEKLISFMRICVELLNLKLLILVGLKAYVSDEEIDEIYKMAAYLKLNLLLIEPVERRALDQEDYYIIDKDRCLIIK